MLTLIKCIGIIIGGLFMSKIVTALFGLLSENSSTIDNETKSIVYAARDLADFLCLLDEDHNSYFEYNTAFYEELFFLCCIEAVKLLNNKKDNKLYNKIINNTFIYSNNLDGIKKYNTVKNIVDDTFKQRSMFYMSLINTYNYNLNNDFFSAAIDYQISIFAIDYKSKPEIKEKIKNILIETIPFIKKFYNNHII